MSKKMMLLALAAVSAAMFALPAAASAQEIHIEGITGFTGTGGAGELTTASEPTITCESSHVENGVVEAGGTTGSMTLDFTGCHVFGDPFTIPCHTTGAPLTNTIKTSGTFHLITYNSAPAILVTPETTVVTCAGISSTHVEGNGLIGTITSPKCGKTSATMELSFSATGSTQNHITYTGVAYDLKAVTVGGTTVRTSGLTGTSKTTATEGKSGTLNCT